MRRKIVPELPGHVDPGDVLCATDARGRRRFAVVVTGVAGRTRVVMRCTQSERVQLMMIESFVGDAYACSVFERPSRDPITRARIVERMLASVGRTIPLCELRSQSWIDHCLAGVYAPRSKARLRETFQMEGPQNQEIAQIQAMARSVSRVSA